MKKVLVTGAAGFVGRHIVKHLLDEGHEVHAVDSLVKGGGGIDPDDGWPLYSPRDYGWKRFGFFCEDCRDWFSYRKDDDFDYVYHLAAVVGGREFIEKNPLAVADDLSIDAVYWQWAAVAKPKKSVIFSSSAAYPIVNQEHRGWALLKEDMVTFDAGRLSFGIPDMSYGWAKLTCEYLAKLAYERHGLKSIIYRPFSGYGVDQDDAYPFPAICKRALANRESKEPLTVWGSGRQMRDFIHINDIVRAVAETVDKIDDGGAVNLSTGILMSMADLARMAAKALGYDPEVIGSTDKPEGVFARGGSIAKLLGLGYCPSITLEEGVKEAMAYYSERM